jgi:hypothetical protein
LFPLGDLPAPAGCRCQLGIRCPDAQPRTAEIARGGGDQILIWIQVKGESDVNYAGREGKLRPGDVAVLDYSREIFVRAPDFASIYVMIERNMVPPAFLAPSMHGTIFAGDGGPGRILYRAVESLFQTIDSLTVAEASVAMDALITMAAGMLEGDLARRAARNLSGHPLFDKALAFIDRNLARVSRRHCWRKACHCRALASTACSSRSAACATPF